MLVPLTRTRRLIPSLSYIPSFLAKLDTFLHSLLNVHGFGRSGVAKVFASDSDYFHAEDSGLDRHGQHISSGCHSPLCIPTCREMLRKRVGPSPESRCMAGSFCPALNHACHRMTLAQRLEYKMLSMLPRLIFFIASGQPPEQLWCLIKGLGPFGFRVCGLEGSGSHSLFCRDPSSTR